MRLTGSNLCASAGAVRESLGLTSADRCLNVMPLFHVHGGALPFYVGHGTVDQSVPFAEAVAFTNSLKAANVPVQFFQAEGGKHTFWADPRFYATNLGGIKKFLGVHLKKNQ